MSEKTVFFQREKQINRLINDFISNFFHLQRPAIAEEYDDMNQQRLEIKRLFDIQNDELYKQSTRRRHVYYMQLSKFKYWYVAWKNLTYYIYLEKHYQCPLHLQYALDFYKNNNIDIKSTIYML